MQATEEQPVGLDPSRVNSSTKSKILAISR
jgi:hypothetical protein